MDYITAARGKSMKVHLKKPGIPDEHSIARRGASRKASLLSAAFIYLSYYKGNPPDSGLGRDDFFTRL